MRSLEQVRANLGSGEAAVVDARGAGRFAGSEAEPRPGVRSGHIPGSRNIPFTQARARVARSSCTLPPRQRCRACRDDTFKGVSSAACVHCLSMI